MQALRVLIDGRPLVGNRTGIGVHTAEIARRLPFDPPPLIAAHAKIEDLTGLDRCHFRIDPYPLGILWQQLAMPRIDADVVWGPHGTLPVALHKPSVVSLHDFTSITMPGRHRMQTILSFNLFIGRSLEMASRVAAVSRAVADEAMRGFGVAASKLEIVPNGVDEFFSPGGPEENYALYVGTLEPRKGVEDLLAVWRSIPSPKPKLILAGDAGWRTRVGSDDGIEVAGFTTRERLRELYRGAKLFIYPSHYEGFGIPPLEAMACGAPVVATRTGAIPDYAEGSALLVPPADREALRAAIVRVLGDRAFRDELRERGPLRASLHRWDKSAEIMTHLLVEAHRCG